jgi:carbon storage regulator CsrA
MLVLSRKPEQKVCFPDLGITVEILRVKGSKVRIGVDAPVEVRILRDELNESDGAQRLSRSHVIRLPQSARHEMRNELNSLSLALHLFKQEMDAGKCQDAEATFEKLIQYVRRLSGSNALSQEGVPADESSELTALLVEDEANEREMLAGFLRLQGYEVATAADGLEAMEYLESNEKPTVILIDMRMPRCDGPTTIRNIRENPAFDRVKIFAISGSSADEIKLDAKKEGVNQWFMKPLNPQSLVEAMAVSGPEPTAA